MVPGFAPPALSCLSNLKIGLSKMELLTLLFKLVSPGRLAQSPKESSSFSIYLQLHCYYLGPSRHVTSEIRISILTSLLLFLASPSYFPYRTQSYLININLILSLPCLKPTNGSICTRNIFISPCLPPAGFGPSVPLQHQLTALILHHAQACRSSVNS